MCSRVSVLQPRMRPRIRYRRLARFRIFFRVRSRSARREQVWEKVIPRYLMVFCLGMGWLCSVRLVREKAYCLGMACG